MHLEVSTLKDRRSFTEKRAYPRMIMNTDLTYTLPGNSQLYAGFCNNLSHSGIHFSTQNALSAGTSLDVTIKPQSDKLSPLKARVEVIRVDPGADSAFGIAGRVVEYK